MKETIYRRVRLVAKNNIVSSIIAVVIVLFMMWLWISAMPILFESIKKLGFDSAPAVVLLVALNVVAYLIFLYFEKKPPAIQKKTKAREFTVSTDRQPIIPLTLVLATAVAFAGTKGTYQVVQAGNHTAVVLNTRTGTTWFLTHDGKHRVKETSQ